jgi:hypothetical protein
MRRPLAAAVALLSLASPLVALLAGPASASVPYSVEIVRPRGEEGRARVRGTVAVLADVRGLGEASDVRFVLTEPDGGWDPASARALELRDDGLWAGSFDSRAIANARYRLIVRAWGGSGGPYDPDDDSTFAVANLIVEVGNPPEIPQGVVVEGGAGGLTVRWDEVPEAGRSDFAGYEVYLDLADEAGACPAFPGDYSLRSTTFATSHSEGGLDAARYCARARALRTSPSSGQVPSGISEAAVGSVSPGDGSSPGSPGEGQYSPSLPYSPITDVTPVPGGGVAGPEAEEAGTDEARNRWMWMAGGLVVVVLSLLLRRYVRTAPGG